jgi:hypothetical protein
MPANAFSLWWHFPFFLLNYHGFQCGFPFHVPAIHLRLLGWAWIWHWFFVVATSSRIGCSSSSSKLHGEW